MLDLFNPIGAFFALVNKLTICILLLFERDKGIFVQVSDVIELSGLFSLRAWRTA